MKYYDYEICPPGTKIKSAEGWELYTEFEGQEIHRRSVMWKYENKFGAEWIRKPIYFNVATGASVTGCARAKLLDAIHTVGENNVIYCDTDSLVLHKCDYSGLSLGGELGQWESEGEFLRGHFAGKKMYGMMLKEIDPKTGRRKLKIASKGSRLDYIHMKQLIMGKVIKWENQAPSFSIANGINFVVRNIRSTA